MSTIQEFAFVYISPSKGRNKISSWEDKINENFGPLSGYASDLRSGKSVDIILLDLLKLQVKEKPENINYLNIRGIYLEHVKSLQNLSNEDSTLKQEILTLELESPSLKTVEILKKYGILTGIEWFIPYEKIFRNYDDFMGENTYKGGRNPYKDYWDYWDDIISANNYIPVKGFKYYDLKLTVQVLIFSKVKFKLIDVTNFVSNVTTNAYIGSGGNFSIKMNLISQSDLEQENKSFLQDNNLNITGYQKALFLQSVFRENDLVFIRFEKLRVENYDSKEGYSSLEVQNNNAKKKIKGRYWDMIGLIDNTSINTTYDNIEITISGRDLIKLLIEDYNFFIPIQFGNTPETIFGGGGTKIFKRLFTNGEYNLEFTKALRSIENTVGFILSQLTNTEILSPACVELLVKEYGDDLSKQFEYNKGQREEKQLVIKGIWGLVNYYVDEKITHYRLADASLKSPNGSVLQQIGKCCQQPFVEVIADTFVDKYSLIIRRPPFTIEDIYQQKFIIIGKESTISENLIFNQEVYTIFQLNPQGGCFVNNNSIPLAYLPMVVLDEYVKLWGNKLYAQTFDYINIDAFTRVSENNNQISSMKETFVDALIWLIEANAYLPFSRKGTITIRGDRRIKIGQWIYFEKTNEIFYVEGVQHSVNVSGGNLDRRSVLKVSRGLVKDYIKPKKLSQNINVSSVFSNLINKFSYGDLINIQYLKEGLKELFIKMNKNFSFSSKNKKKSFTKTDSVVNSEVFNFFLSGAQFEGKIYPYIKDYYDKPAIDLNSIDLMQKQQDTGRTLENVHSHISSNDNQNSLNENIKNIFK